MRWLSTCSICNMSRVSFEIGGCAYMRLGVGSAAAAAAAAAHCTAACVPLACRRESMHFDLLVVGAGPAGLSAAIRFKQAR